MFIWNRGQWPGADEFVAPVARGALRIGRDSFLLQRTASSDRDGPSEDPRPKDLRKRGSARDAVVCGVNLRFTFEGTCAPAPVQGEEVSPTHVNFYGASGRFEDVPAFASVRCESIYPGIDVVFRGRAGAIDYDLEIAPGADPTSVVLRCEGADRLTIGADGALIAQTSIGPVSQSPPVAFVAATDERLVCHFVLRDSNSVGFCVPDWRGDRPLIIDPGLAFGTYLDSAGADQATAVTIDAAGSAYVGGQAGYLDFPTTPGAFSTNCIGSSGFLTKLTPDGSHLAYSTFIDGSLGATSVQSIAVTTNGKAVVAGYSQSQTFWTSNGAWDTSFNGGEWDGFVLELNAIDGSLAWSTYLGGSGDDYLDSAEVDADGFAYVSGYSESSDYPTTDFAWDGFNLPPGDVVVTKLAPDGAALVYSTFIGGSASSGEQGFASALDDDGSVIVAGWASPGFTADFPVTAGAWDTSFNGYGDAFVARLDPTGHSLVFCTLLGGVGADVPYAVHIAPDHSIYVAGNTESSNFPATPGAFDKTYGGLGDGFIAHFDASGSTLLGSTFLGGSSSDEIRGIGMDLEGTVIVGGTTGSSSFPITPGAFDTVKNLSGEGGGDGFLVRLDASLSHVQYGTYLGGGGNLSYDQVWDAAISPSGEAAIVGQTAYTTGFPVTAGAWDNQSDGNDAFLVRFNFSPWFNLGGGAGAICPRLAGSGSLEPATSGAITLTDAEASKPGVLVLGFQPVNMPLKNAVLVPAPWLLLPVVTDGQGTMTLAWSSWPVGVSVSTTLYLQAWMQTATGGTYSVSNALLAVTPGSVGG